MENMDFLCCLNMHSPSWLQHMAGDWESAQTVQDHSVVCPHLTSLCPEYLAQLWCPFLLVLFIT